MRSAAHRLTIAGTGTSAATQMTPETRAALVAADCVVSILGARVPALLPPDAAPAECVDLHALYERDRERVANYEHAAAASVEAALRHRHTVLLTPGAPSVYDRLVTLVVEHATRVNVDVRVLPAVSSIESCLALLGEDVAPGLQIVEARWMLRKPLAARAELAHLIYQPGAVNTDRMPTADDLDPRNLAALREHLRAAFPDDHPVVFVRAPESTGDPGYVRRTTVGALCAGTARDLAGTSLFVPAAGYERFGWRRWHDL